MKGIVLAGGNGTRLYPLTINTSKQLLPVYDKPMIYYPLSTLMLFGIRDILIISTPRDLPNIEKLFGDGSHLGLKISYKAQPKPQGIAQAFTIGADFIQDDPVALILGDNIFYFGTGNIYQYVEKIKANPNNAVIFASQVPDPERFGVVEFNKEHKVISIEEKPKQPKSNYVSVGLYFYPGDIVKKASSLTPSARGELEITDLNNLYRQEGRLMAMVLGRGNAWLDAGTPDSLLESSAFISILEHRQGLKLACLEEVALRQKFIDEKQFLKFISELGKCNYKTYLEKVHQEIHGV